MGELKKQISHLLRDIKNSWYFRVWGILWLVCFIISLVAFGILGKESSQSQSRQYMDQWIENATHLTYPRFHLRTQSTEYIQSLKCYRNNIEIPTLPCGLLANPEPQCLAVNSDSITVENKYNQPLGDLMVYCQLHTNGSTNNSLVTWGLEGQDVGPFGPNAFSGLYILPNDNSWVLLEQRTIHQTRKLPTEIQWSRSLVYHTSDYKAGWYGITTIIGSFYVTHLEPTDVYDGWKSVSDFGGFMFALVVIHTMIMLFVGIVFENNSSLLKGSSHDDNELSQRTPLVAEQQ